MGCNFFRVQKYFDCASFYVTECHARLQCTETIIISSPMAHQNTNTYSNKFIIESYLGEKNNWQKKQYRLEIAT